MGFYFTLGADPRTPGLFLQMRTPGVFWVLYSILGFALACMGGAALTVLQDLARTGTPLDRAFFYGFLATIPIYFIIGLYLAAIRKFILCEADLLTIGYRLRKKTILSWAFSRSEIESFEIVNHLPTPNLATKEHDNPQYYPQGHWKLMAHLNNGQHRMVDRHSERAALLPLFNFLEAWLRA